MEKINSKESCNADVIRGAGSSENMNAQGHFTFVCIDKNGDIKWMDESDNVVTNQGKNNMLDTYLGNTQVPTPMYMSLIVAGAATSTSTYLASTVQEITGNVVTSGTRPLMTWTAASTGAKSANTTSFSILASATIIGNMVVTSNISAAGPGGTLSTNVNAVGNTVILGATLFSSSNFTGGSKNVSNGDTLNVSYSVSV
jgi:hypothetical protein